MPPEPPPTETAHHSARGPRRVLFMLGSLAGGGAERQVVQYLKYLDRSQFSPVLYLICREGPFLKDLPDDVAVEVFEERVGNGGIYYPGKIHRQQGRDLRRVIDDHDIELVCAITFYMVLIAGDALPGTSLPWIAINMADPRRDLQNEIRRFRIIKHWKLKRAYRAASRSFAVSAGDREGLLESYRLDPSKTVVLHNSVDVAVLDQQLQEYTPDWPSDKFHIVTAGRLNEQKGHRYLLKAMKRLVHNHGRNDVRLHILGTGELEEELRRLTENFDLVDHVEFHGFVVNPFPMIQAADLFCFPSLYEGFPLTLLEVMACRTPIVASDCLSGPREILQNGRWGRLVEPEDVDQLSDAILAEMNTNEDRHEKLELARESIVSAHDSRIIVNELETHLKQVLDEAAST